MKIKIKVATTVAEGGGFLQPGRVDVLHTRPDGEKEETRTLVKDVQMFQFIAEGIPGPGTAWLEVTPEQAGILNEAKKTGSLNVTPHKRAQWKFW